MFLIAFQLFDVAHLSWLFISLLLILIMCSHYRRLSAASRHMDCLDIYRGRNR